MAQPRRTVPRSASKRPPAERAAEFAQVQRRLKEEAAARRRNASGANSSPPAKPRGG